jgi:hypothetical protein
MPSQNYQKNSELESTELDKDGNKKIWNKSSFVLS